MTLGVQRARDALCASMDVMLTGAALVHVIGFLIALGYAQNYYFHLRTCCS